MTILDILNVKWWALLIGVVVNFIAGMLWYGPLFGKKWMQLVGLTEEKIRENSNPLIYVGSLITALINTYVLGMVLNLVGTQTVPAAIGVGLLLWFGFSVIPTINHSSYEGRPAQLVAINASYGFVTVLIMSIVLQLAK